MGSRICVGALVLLVPPWALAGGSTRVLGAFRSEDIGGRVGGSGGYSLFSGLPALCVADGALYFSEQLAQFEVIGLVQPLTLAVVDTTRRLFIVVIAGFILQGDKVTPTRVAGALLVYSGAAAYAYVTNNKKTKKSD